MVKILHFSLPLILVLGNKREGKIIYPKYDIPSISQSGLLEFSTDVDGSGSDYEIVLNALTKTGILAVKTTDNGKTKYSRWRKEALRGFCECMSSPRTRRELSVLENYDRSILEDGLTTRTSIATATSKEGVALDLPVKIDSVCGSKQRDSMEKLRDYVHQITGEFVNILDKLIISEEKYSSQKKSVVLLQTTSQKKSFSSVDSIIQNANHLEHFHLYSKTESKTKSEKMDNDYEEIVLNTHTDAGLFLSFVPALSCDDNDDDDDDTSFFIEVDDVLKEAVFPRDSVIFMLGVGAEQWLQNIPENLKLRATRHAVKMKQGSNRAWYGMMHLVPENAIIQNFPTQATFADMRYSMLLRSKKYFKYSESTLQLDDSNKDIAIGCGVVRNAKESTFDSKNNNNFIVKERRRLQLHVDASECNNNTNFYCWMSCVSIPNANKAASLTKEGKSLYCADHTKMDDGDLANAVKFCTDPLTGAAGGAMNTDCVGIWADAVEEDIPSQQLNIPVMRSSLDESASMEEEEVEEPYCYSGTSMYMNGFQWKGVYCVIYLFPSWILNTPSKMAIACIGTLFTAVGLEGVITARRILLPKIQKRQKKLLCSTIIYGLQLTLGYLIMLVVMTYSVPLFLCCIFGLMMGHFFFHLMIPTITADDAVVVEGATPCCQNSLSTSKQRTSQSTKWYSYQNGHIESISGAKKSLVDTGNLNNA